MNLFKKIFSKKINAEVNKKKLPDFATSKEFADKIYKDRKQEIESLLQHDRGEKTIHPIDTRSFI